MKKSMNARTRRRSGAALAGLLSLAMLVGCAENDGAGTSRGDGVTAGASKADYQAAFESMDQITLVTQTPGPSGSPTSRHIENYVAAVEEWSGGKITFDVTFSTGIAAPDEWAAALTDGRLDVGLIAPTYEPQRFPASNILMSLTALGINTPVGGTLARQGFLNEVGLNSDALREEYEKNDLHLLVSAVSYGPALLGCIDEMESLDDFKGGTTSVSSQAGGAQADALGLNPASIPYTELFEGLQRGVIDCTHTHFASAALTGVIPEAEHVYADPAHAFAGAPATLAVSNQVWEDLPLAAQQLLFDRLDAFFVGLNQGAFEAIAQVDEQARAAGGSVQPLPADATEALASGTEDLLASIAGDVPGGAELVEEAEAAATKWQGIVEELGLEEHTEYDGFNDWYTDGLDQSPWIDRFFTEAMNAHRPS